MKAEILAGLDESIAVKQRVKEQADAIVQVVEAAVRVYRGGGKLVFLGNGGSAADAQHLAAELVGKFLLHRAALPALALHTNTSILTAVGNDLSYDEVFSRQVEALVTEKDLVFGISTSGNSPNVLRGLQAAKEKGATTVGMTGGGGGKLAAMADLVIAVPSTSTPRIQEAHITIGHLICEMIEKSLFGS